MGTPEEVCRSILQANGPQYEIGGVRHFIGRPRTHYRELRALELTREWDQWTRSRFRGTNRKQQ